MPTSPQLLMNLYNTLPSLCRHTEHMLKGVGAKSNILIQNDSNEKLDNFFRYKRCNMFKELSGVMFSAFNLTKCCSLGGWGGIV